MTQRKKITWRFSQTPPGSCSHMRKWNARQFFYRSSARATAHIIVARSPENRWMWATNKVPRIPLCYVWCVYMYIRDFSGTTCPRYDEDTYRLWDHFCDKWRAIPGAMSRSEWRGRRRVTTRNNRKYGAKTKITSVVYSREIKAKKNKSSTTHWLTSRRELRTREEPVDSSATLDQRGNRSCTKIRGEARAALRRKITMHANSWRGGVCRIRFFLLWCLSPRESNGIAFSAFADDSI